MPRWMFALFAAALFLAVAGIIITFLRTGPTANQPATPPARSGTP